MDKAVHSPCSGEDVGLSPEILKGTALVLEDNFVIAKEMADLLDGFGFEDVLRASNVDKALDFIEDETPMVAVLDVNLGGDQTSELVARRLMDLNVAFVFVTGYGERARLSSDLTQVPRLTKPVDETELKRTLVALLGGRSDHSVLRLT